MSHTAPTAHAGVPRAPGAPPIHTIAVLGAGIMGRGIAYAAALGGYATILQDTSADALDRGIGEIQAVLEKGVLMGKVDEQAATGARSRLKTSRSLEESARGADLVIEAVPESIELKVEIFGTLDRCAPKHAILASNTSSLSITEMAAATERPKQVVGMHFFNPVHRMKLLEIVRALETSEETIGAARAVGVQMGKECVVVRESPGFVTSRINAMIGNEAFYMLQEGVASARDIDTALKLGLNHPMGPFELVDLVGLDTRLSILRFLQRTLGDKFRPCPLLEQYVAAGRLGRKSGRGVYDYPAS
jgi:3-hydroxybutyryl-CoA dehydrogenase